MALRTQEDGALCARCGGAADEVSRRGGVLFAGYGSRHDTARFAILKEEAVPAGDVDFCDGCVDALVKQGALCLTGHFGEVKKGLPGAAYAQLFRMGKTHMREVLSSHRTPDQIVDAIVGVEQHNPARAGLVAALMEAAGFDVTGLADRYGANIETHQKDMETMINFILEEMGGS